MAFDRFRPPGGPPPPLNQPGLPPVPSSGFQPRPAPQGGQGFLPFTGDVGSSFQQLFSQLQGAQAPERDLQQATDWAMRDANRRGIQGPLAATIGGEARGQVIQGFQQNRQRQLMDLLNLAMQAQNAEAQRRMQSAQMQGQAAQADRKNRQGMFSSVGTGLGGLLGTALGSLGGPLAFLTGPLGSAAGGALGGLLEQGLTSAGLFGPEPSYQYGEY